MLEELNRNAIQIKLCTYLYLYSKKRNISVIYNKEHYFLMKNLAGAFLPPPTRPSGLAFSFTHTHTLHQRVVALPLTALVLLCDGIKLWLHVTPDNRRQPHLDCTQ